MPLYSVSNGSTGWASDVDQVIDAITGKNDVDITAFAPIAAPVAPTVAINAVAGSLTGAYKYAVALITGYWQGPTGTGTLLTEGNTSGGTVSATVSPTAQQVSLTNIPIGGTGVVARIIYRTKAGGSTFYQLVQIDDNTTTAWIDNTADASITTVMPSANTTGSKFVGNGSGLTNIPIPTTYGPETGVTNAYVVTLSPAPTALTAGMVVQFLAGHANTGASTLNPNSLGVKSIKMEDGSDPPAGTIPANSIAQVVYDGTNFRFMATGLAAHQADYVRQPGFAITTGTGTAYVATLAPVPTAYVDGFAIEVYVHLTNTGACTLNVNTLGATPLKKADGTDFAAGEFAANQIYSFRKYGANFIQVVKGGGSNTKSIQTIATTMNAVNTLDLTISAVDPNKTLVYVCYTSATSTANTVLVKAILLNATTVRCTTGGNATSIDVFIQVIEFNNVKSKQTGDKAIVYGTNNIAISSVNLSKSILVASWQTTDSTQNARDALILYKPTSSTNIQVKANTSYSLHWQVIEFN